MSKVAKQLNRGRKASEAISRNLAKVILGHKDPVDWRLESTKVGLTKLVGELETEIKIIKAATEEKEHIQASAAREALGILVTKALSVSSWLARIDELEAVKLDLAQRK